jgi:hypothetical protein
MHTRATTIVALLGETYLRVDRATGACRAVKLLDLAHRTGAGATRRRAIVAEAIALGRRGLPFEVEVRELAEMPRIAASPPLPSSP